MFVFDDVLLHHFKERSLFDLATQPFAPINLVNEIMENTGMFCEADTSMTSIFIVDKESSSMMFRKDELSHVQHLESMTDQIVDFSSDRVSLTKGMMPLIDMKPDKTIIDYWQSPLLKKVKKELQSLIGELTESHTMHVLRKQMKMGEDPWDNYLIYDAKYFVPLLCHNTDIPIEQQVLLVRFIRQSIAEETISQYKLKSSLLINELVSFAQDFKDDEDEPNILQKIKTASQDYLLKPSQIAEIESEMERVVKMFYLQMKVKGHLKALKDDYFV